jgi:hypothetical protein
VSGLFTRRGIGLSWDKIDIRPAVLREQQLLERRRKRERLLELLLVLALARK